jgi:hypothetical protein
MKTMSWAFQDGFVLVAHADKPPSDEEWRLYVHECAELGYFRGGIALTDGHGPNASQRAMVVEHQGLLEVPFAIVTSSVVVRGIVTALRWLGKDIRAFSPSELPEALLYLKVEGEQRTKVHDKLIELRMSMLDDSTVSYLNGFRTDQRDEYVLSTPLPLIRREVEDLRRRMTEIA